MSKATQRLAALELADQLGNVAEACRRSGITRTQFYRYRQRHAASGLAGLQDETRQATRHPCAISEVVTTRIAALSLEHPAAGCDRLAALLDAEGVALSAVAVHKYLHILGLGTRRDRWLQLESRSRRRQRLAPAQVDFVVRCNPCFGERSWKPARPGACIAQDSLQFALPGVPGRQYLHTAVDTRTGLAFASLHDNKRPESAVALLYTAVMPFLEERGLALEAVVTDAGGEFHGNARHPFRLYLQLAGLAHLAPRQPGTVVDGFSERFHRDIRAEWLPKLPGLAAGAARASLAGWLLAYNRHRPFEGYPSHGKSPLQALSAMVRESKSATPFVKSRVA